MNKNWFGRLLLLFGFGILAALFTWQAFGAESTLEAKIIEIKTSIPLSETENKVKDYYIYGSVGKLKPNSVVKVVRKSSVRDHKLGQNVAEILIPVATMKIIYSENSIAVGRELKPISRENEPLLEQIGIMVGDQVIAQTGSKAE